MTTVGVAFTDEHRRVLGHLSHPRSLTSLTRALDTDLGAPSLGVGAMDRIDGLLEDCVAEGWAKNLGEIRKAKDLANIPNDDPDVIDIPKEQADILRVRARHRLRAGQYLDDGDKFILTKNGLALLTGPIGNEPPPLTGPALLAALEANVRLAEDAVKAEEGADGRSKHQLDSAKAVLKRQQAALDAYTDEEDEDDE